MKQEAPDPEILSALVEQLHYRPGWTFELTDLQRDEDHGRGVAGGLTFIVTTLGYNSYHPERGETCAVHHYFIVPAATYDERAWRRWLLDSLLKVESHECCEFFRLGQHRPFAPVHAPGADPYTIVEYASDVERRTSFRGEVGE